MRWYVLVCSTTFSRAELIELAQARTIVAQSKGVQRTRELAEAYAAKAREVLDFLPDSEAKEALAVMTEKVVKRKH